MGIQWLVSCLGVGRNLDQLKPEVPSLDTLDTTILKYLSGGTQGILSTKFSQPKLATASQIVSHTLRAWRLMRGKKEINTLSMETPSVHMLNPLLCIVFIVSHLCFYMSHFSYSCKTKLENGFSHLISERV